MKGIPENQNRNGNEFGPSEQRPFLASLAQQALPQQYFPQAAPYPFPPTHLQYAGPPPQPAAYQQTLPTQNGVAPYRPDSMLPQTFNGSNQVYPLPTNGAGPYPQAYNPVKALDNGASNVGGSMMSSVTDRFPDSNKNIPAENGLLRAEASNPDLNPAASAKDVKKEAKKEEEKEEPKVGFFQLFHFANRRERIMIFFAILCSSAQGIGLPVFSVIFGNLTNSVSPNQSTTDFLSDSLKNSLIMLGIGVGIFILCFTAVILWNVIAASQIRTIKRNYFAALLRKSTTWYDKQKIDELSVKFIENCDAISTVFSEKMHVFFMSLFMAFSGLAIGLITGWAYSLLIYALLPLMVIGVIIFGATMAKQQDEQTQIYSQAGAVSDQAFTFIKAVKSLGGEEHEIEKYRKGIDVAMKGAIRSSVKVAGSLGIFFGTILLVYGISFLIGSRIISAQWWNSNKSENYNVGSVLAIFFAVTTGFFAFGNLVPVLKEMIAARVAMTHVMKIVNPESEEIGGTFIPENFQGKIEFRNVTFFYPTNPERQIIRNLSFTVEPGQKVGLIGPSGSGKSTVVQLLERFYDPSQGQILIDDVDIREYNITFLRSRLGMVQQQPVLFADTIRANMLLGVDNATTVSDEVLLDCLQRCNAREFVMKLEKGLNEYVGSLGEKLSGGQKQRIAIARTIIRDPRIFLFDEATSALDRRNEAEIQRTIEEVSRHATSVTIAHRLVTVRNCHKIMVLKNGDLLETGSHDELMANPNSYYRSMVDKQFTVEEPNDDDEPAEVKLPDAAPALERFNSDAQPDSRIPRGPSLHEALAPQTPAPAVAPSKPKQKIELMKYMTDSKWILVGALVSAFVNGAVMPIFGMVLGFVIGKLGDLDYIVAQNVSTSLSGQTKDQVLKDIDSYVIIFCCMAVASFLANTLQYGLFAYIGERYTFNLRYHYFRRTLYQDATYFDQEENTPGAISGRLSTKCKSVNSLVTTYLGSISQSISSFFFGILIGMIFSWRLGLVALGISPILFLNGLVESRVMAGMSVEEKKKNSDSVLPDTLNNMRLVRSLNAQMQLLEKFMRFSEGAIQRILKKMWKSAFLLAFSQFGMFLVYAVLFYLGAVFVRYSGDKYLDMMTCMFAVIFGAYGAGMANQFLGNLTEARDSAKVIIGEIDTPNSIEVDPQNPQRTLLKIGTYVPQQVVGSITFQNVYFRFPRFETMVLKHLNLVIEPNKSHALVGPSGSGKSTIMQLLLRFYDPTHGAILLDGVDIRDYDLAFLRSIFGIVRQEPTLFNGTIEYNLKYNHPDIQPEQITQALQMSNSFEFVMNEADKLSRDVGNRGEKLSGGQKQRIAIARAILRNPRIFLFDESTSALDSQSEEIVQRAIEHVSRGITSVTIAHRISTIQNCDTIFVLQNGRLIEKGTHSQLIDKRGVFFELAQIK